MKMQVPLSIHQMQELKALGLDCSDASMAWVYLYDDLTILPVQFVNNIINRYPSFDFKPIQSYAYTLEDILRKLPSELVDKDGWFYGLDISESCGFNLWTIKYCNRNKSYKSISSAQLLKAAFEMLKWTVSQGLEINKL